MSGSRLIGRNKAVKSRVKTYIKKVEAAVAAGDKAARFLIEEDFTEEYTTGCICTISINILFLHLKI